MSRIKTLHKNSTQSKKQKQFGILLIVICLVFLGISIYKDGVAMNGKQQWFIFSIGVLTIITLFFKKLLYPILFLWLLIGEVFGRISSFVILAIVYFLIFSPIAMILNRYNRKMRYKEKWIDRKDTMNYESLG